MKKQRVNRSQNKSQAISTKSKNKKWDLIFRKFKKYNYHLILNSFSIIFTGTVAFFTLYKTLIEPNNFTPTIEYTQGNHEFFEVFTCADKLVIYKQLEFTNTGKVIGFINRPELWIINKDSLDHFILLSDCFHGRESSMLFRSFNIQANGLFGQEVRYESRLSSELKKELSLIKDEINNENYYMCRDSLHTSYLSYPKRSEPYSLSNLNQLTSNLNFKPLKNETKLKINDFMNSNHTSVFKEGNFYLVEGAWRQDNTYVSRYFTFKLDSNDILKFSLPIKCYEEGFGVSGTLKGVPLLRIELELVTSEIDNYRINSFLSLKDQN